jgi:signal transduction histidine kinase
MPDSRDVEQRRAYLHLDDEQLALLASLRPVLEKHADSLVDSFYQHLLTFEPTRALLRDPEVRNRLLLQQRDYLLTLTSPTIDDAYVVHRERIGQTHVRIGLEPRWYLGAYALYVSLLAPVLFDELGGQDDRLERTLVALWRRIMFDAQIALGAYMERREADLEYLNRELARTGHRLAERFEAQSAELRRTAERARAAEELASIGTLVAGLAHEIGTPMGVIQGHAKLLESKIEDENGRWRLQTIREQIDRISHIIHALLNMARPTPSARKPVALEPLVETTLAFVSEKLERRGIEVLREYGPVPVLHGDAERLQQLLLNLLLNAADAMPDGGTLRVSLRTTASGEAELRVADTGAGIPPEHLPRIFEPFFTTKEAGKGTGLGLAVVRGIVTDHGGDIEASNLPEGGAEFRLHLPPPDYTV